MAYLHKYVISSDDIVSSSDKILPRSSETIREKTDADAAQMTEFLLNGFNAETNALDRRIYYEVTGRQLAGGGEFDEEEETSSDEEWRARNRPDPLAHVFDYHSDSDDVEGQGDRAASGRTDQH